MTILQIECFVETAKTGNISKAAARLFMSQQGVSKHIRALEKELGFPLFERHNMGVRLTESGEAMFAVWDPAIQAHRTALDKARDIHSGVQNTIRIGLLDCGGYNETILENIVAYNEQFPDISVEYEFLMIKDLFEGLDSGKLSLAFVYESELPQEHKYHVLPVRSTPIRTGIYVSKKSPMPAGKYQSELIRGQTLGVLNEDISRDFKNKVEQYLRENHLEDQVRFRFYNARHNLGMGLMTQKCITIVYETMFEHLKDKLSFIPIPDLEGVGMIDLIWKNDQYEAKARNLAEIFLKA